MALAMSTVGAQDPLSKGKGKGNQTGGGSQTGGGGKSQGGGGGNSGGGLGNQGKSQGSGQGSGLGKGQGGGNSGGGSQSGGGKSQGGGNSGGGNSGGGLGNQGKSQGGGNSGLGNKGQTGGGSSSGWGSSGGRSNGDQLGRVDNPNNRGQNSLGKGNDRGRLGGTSYGSSNNRRERFDIGQAPTQILNKGSIQSQVLRSEQVRVNTQFRNGYYSYYNNWQDDYFYYPHYQFSPYGSNCSFSPWYYYPHLPGYVALTRIFYISNHSWNWNNGDNYNWNRGNRGNDWGWGNDRDRDRNDSALDDSLYDLVNAFERQDRRALGRLIPRRGRINIYMDDNYCYSLEADDFYDLMLDNIETTRTVRYEIERVRTYRDEVQVTARHEYSDPWGRRSSVYHNFRLEEDRYGYVITDFRTSWRR